MSKPTLCLVCAYSEPIFPNPAIKYFMPGSIASLVPDDPLNQDNTLFNIVLPDLKPLLNKVFYIYTKTSIFCNTEVFDKKRSLLVFLLCGTSCTSQLNSSNN